MKKILIALVVIIVIAGGFFLFRDKINTSGHKYQSNEFGLYYDGSFDNAEVGPSNGPSTTETLFIFTKNGTNDHLAIMRAIQGQQIEVDKSIEKLIEGSKLVGQEVINDIIFDHYSFPNQVASAIYVASHNNIRYCILLNDPTDIKYFGFVK